MKSRLSLALLLLSALLFASCAKKKNENEIITHKPKAVKPSAVRKMGDYHQQTKVAWVGSEYTVDLDFRADTSLPVVYDGEQRYYDNHTTLRILRKDGSEFLKREFAKSDFLQYISGSFGKDGAFLGVVFDKAEGDNLIFAASVGSPDKSSDEYIPLVVKVGRMGNITISKDTQLDTTSSEGPSDESEEDGV
ncbi:DUF4738 domain-containing protein [Prevotella sp. KH2C16]|uniref:DUF4738 domain-containing protein n=1 Tax=Prevotella sp. KH2C16 TaxID=1855325 RepID=UPI0008F31BE0|nr:DUF4738 domain-containing protein [Prevotella sp. KH2C16]SFG15810.1 protein of unknown function [Prevotella sp. KH2C16]